MDNPQTHAALYLLTCLLHRLENTHPGLIDDLLDGVHADWQAVPDDAQDKAHVDAIFEESLTLLKRAHTA